ncbi:LysR substrate-binding domain-containing protein [Pikeienuella sp. HZG-20]|uniref:LysR substrate-binding domain-containing protein n=1 Tax=Paludibacillus litoralis TaxID=3133267 RepID=UPI0030EB5E9E
MTSQIRKVRDLDTRRLRHFMAIARSGSFIKASQVLGVAQPALSQQMSNLETEIGVRFFDRSNRGVVLTQAGEILFNHAQTILANIDRARDDLARYAHDQERQLTLVMPGSISQILAGPLYLLLRSNKLSGTLNLHDHVGDEAREQLISGQVKLALGYKKIQHPGIRSFPILTEELYLVTLPPSEEAPAEIALRDLVDFPLVLPAKPNGMREAIDREAASLGVTLNPAAEINTLGTLLSSLRAKIGGSLLPIAAISAELEKGELAARRVVDPPIVRTLYFSITGVSALSSEDLALVEIVLTLISEMTEDGSWPGADLQLDHALMNSLLGK